MIFATHGVHCVLISSPSLYPFAHTFLAHLRQYHHTFVPTHSPGDFFLRGSVVPPTYRVSQKKHSYKFFGLEIMLFTCSQTLWSGLRSSFTKWGTAPAFTTACKTTMSASRWRAWSLVQKFYKSVFSGTPCTNILVKIMQSYIAKL